MITNSLVHQITLGREGKNWGYTMGMPKLEGVIDGVTKGVYTLLFSGTGAGKTSLALYSYIYRPLMEHLDDEKFKVTYYSLEMSAEQLFAKLLCMYIFETYGVELSAKELFSRKKGYKLPEKEYQLVLQSLPWLHKVEKIITIHDKSLNAEILYASLKKELELRGKFTKTETRTIYEPDDEDVVHLVVIDHLSLVRKAQGRSLKEEMDLISAYLVTLRNRCSISPLVIMQMNRDSTSMDRKKAGYDNMQLSDIKDTGSPAQDSEIVISIFNPSRERLNSYKDYDIKTLGARFRSITVLKNRFGESDVEIGSAFYGKCGLWKEMPRGDEIVDYSKYLTSQYMNEKDEIIKEEEKMPIKKKEEFKINITL